VERGTTAKSPLVLNHHANYSCRRSGACCTAGWRIPVEPDRVEGVRALLSEREAFEDGARILRLTPAGACVLFSRGRGTRPRPCIQAECSLQRVRGHAALPSACRHFPRRYLHDRHASRVALSHYCPTAAAMLFDEGDIRIVTAPDDLSPPGDRDGLDARDALPPLLRPGMLMDVESYALWEALAIERLSVADAPERAVTRIAAATERLRRWRPGPKLLTDAVREAFDEPAEEDGTWIEEPEPTRLLCASAASAVPAELRRESWPIDPNALDEFVAPAWPRFSGPIRRYLAGRLFGSWTPYQGRGLRTVVASVACGLAVLRCEAGRACAAASRPLDEALLTSAIRAADRLLVHEADSQALADQLSVLEQR
jgi:Fe-S-cluster containining protein